MNKLVKTAIIIFIFLCASNISYAERITKQQELDKLSVFISNFVEARIEVRDIKSFLTEKNADKLLEFGIFHNYLNNWKTRFENAKCPKDSEGKQAIETKYVVESIEKFFGYKLKTLPESINGSTVLKNNCYYLYAGDGEMYPNAIVSYAERNPKNNHILLAGITYYPDYEDGNFDSDGIAFFTAEVKPAIWNRKQTYNLIRLVTHSKDK
ncbi:MAG: hypothetical protein IKI22_03850 [Neisseriaceae bacterium]|nr:hypothetical protein [Neisseriaceae bacterium]